MVSSSLPIRFNFRGKHTLKVYIKLLKNKHLLKIGKDSYEKIDKKSSTTKTIIPNRPNISVSETGHNITRNSGEMNETI